MLASRSSLIGFILSGVLVVVLPLTVVFSKYQQDYIQHASGIACTSMGAVKNSNGTYHFSWLKVLNGHIVDDNGCLVYLRGLNIPGTEFDTGTASNLTEQTINNFNQTFVMNLWRLPFNAHWWIKNEWVPNAVNPATGVKGMHYQDWIAQVIGWAEKHGDYVELNKGTEWTEPPCGGSIKTCVHQNGTYTPNGTCTPDQVTGLCGPDFDTTYGAPQGGKNITLATLVWQDIANRYANNPAILFNTWNEMNEKDGLTPDIWRQNEESLIQTIRSKNPNSLIMLGGPNFNGSIDVLTSGKEPDFTDTNLVIDMHEYGLNPVSPWWSNQTLARKEVTWLTTHNHSFMIGEWGGTSDATISGYHNFIVSFAQNYQAPLTYYQMYNLYTNGILNGNGTLVQQSYAALPGINQISSTPTPSPTEPTPSVSPSQNETQFNVTVCPHGLGNCGDNVSPTGGNTNPLHLNRSITLTIFNTNQTKLTQQQGLVTYNGNSSQTGTGVPNFQGIIPVPNLPSGTYLVSVKMDGFLANQIPKVINVTQGQQVILPSVSLETGDIDNNNQVDLLDYNILVSCFGDRISTSSCPSQYKPSSSSPGADILDDGPGPSAFNTNNSPVDGGDYNEFLRELSVQSGQ